MRLIARCWVTILKRMLRELLRLRVKMKMELIMISIQAKSSTQWLVKMWVEVVVEKEIWWW
jgi:hypothetical protein